LENNPLRTVITHEITILHTITSKFKALHILYIAAVFKRNFGESCTLL